MRCASVLLDSRNLDIEGKSNNDDDDGRVHQLTDEEVYDVPRALTKVPVRRENTSEENDKVDDWVLNDSRESNAVLQSEGVQSKMVKSVGGRESFFSVVTKR